MSCRYKRIDITISSEYTYSGEWQCYLNFSTNFCFFSCSRCLFVQLFLLSFFGYGYVWFVVVAVCCRHRCCFLFFLFCFILFYSLAHFLLLMNFVAQKLRVRFLLYDTEMADLLFFSMPSFKLHSYLSLSLLLFFFLWFLIFFVLASFFRSFPIFIHGYRS